MKKAMWGFLVGRQNFVNYLITLQNNSLAFAPLSHGADQQVQQDSECLRSDEIVIK